MDTRVAWDEALRFGGQTLQKNFALVCGLIGFPMLGCALAAGLLDAGLMALHLDARTAQAISRLITLPLQIFAAMGAINIALKLVDEKQAGIDEFINTKAGFFSFWGVRIVVGIACCVGLLLFIVPGIIWGIKFAFADIALIDKRISAGKALDMSWKMTREVKLDLFIFFLICAAIAVAGLICLFIGLIPAIGVIELARVYIYRKCLLPAFESQEAAT